MQDPGPNGRRIGPGYYPRIRNLRGTRTTQWELLLTQNSLPIPVQHGSEPIALTQYEERQLHRIFYYPGTKLLKRSTWSPDPNRSVDSRLVKIVHHPELKRNSKYDFLYETDGSFSKRTNRGGVGFGVSDKTRKVFETYSMESRIVHSALYQELQALLQALLDAINKRRWRIKVYSDCKNALRLIKMRVSKLKAKHQSKRLSTRVYDTIIEIQNLKDHYFTGRGRRIKFIHCLREGLCIADHLSKCMKGKARGIPERRSLAANTLTTTTEYWNRRHMISNEFVRYIRKLRSDN